MHGFLIHTRENTLLVRNYDYIKHDNPGWWQENLHMISSFWEFDSDNPSEMLAIFKSLSRISRAGMLPVMEVENFCKSIGYDLKKFMQENATSESRQAKVSGQNWDTGTKGATGGFGDYSAPPATTKKSDGD